MSGISTYKKISRPSQAISKNEHRIIVGLSGGINGAVVAALLKAQGRDVMGVHLKLGSPAKPFPSHCTEDPKKSLERAEFFARRLGIPLSIVDAAEMHLAEVEDPFLHERLNGNYNSPCFRCHTRFKVGGLLQEAQRLKVGRVATGHRIASRKDQTSNQFRLFLSTSASGGTAKFLAGLTQADLENLEFPLGEVPDSVIRKIAFELDESVVVATESPEPCMLRDSVSTSYIAGKLPAYLKNPGLIRLGGGGSAIGEHRGVWHYSLGRKLALESQKMSQEKGEWVVAHYDSSLNTFGVISQGDWASKRWLLSSFHTIVPLNQFEPHPVDVHLLPGTHHWPQRPASIRATLLCLEANRVLVEFEEPLPLFIGEVLIFESAQELLGQARVLAQLDRQKSNTGQLDSWGGL
jgi:tRNA-specific 2-thiouridylase